MMKARILFITLLLGTATSGLTQDWALINPAYRYNYTTDGTDTIRSQIRVVQVDTLGPDSFRYDLNQIAQRCLSCPDSCNLHVGIPQFLGWEGQVANGTWYFFNANDGTIMIKPEAAVGEPWIFRPSDNTEATILEVSAQEVLGNIDSVRLLTTAMGDTVAWSKDHGLLHWHIHYGERYMLCGIQGLGIGRSIPGLYDFFRFQPGDMVLFRRQSVSMYPYSSSSWERFHIQERVEQPGNLKFIGYSNYRYFNGHSGVVSYSTMQQRTWTLDSATTDFVQPIYSSPNEVVRIGGSLWQPEFMIAHHGIDSVGSYVIHSGTDENRGLFFWPDHVDGECQSTPPQYPSTGTYYLDSQLGIRYFNQATSPYDASHFWTIGAVISGDTIGTVFNDDFFLGGIQEIAQGSFYIHPNPCSDVLFIHTERPLDGHWKIMGIGGNILGNGQFTFDIEQAVDVSSLSDGIYLFDASTSLGRISRRFTILR
ncbi:MAG: hypothetical protein M9900_10655 [Flavobacteriales bacterium]|nr:hypothetical protein [Flavobacteriales bacterium]